MADVAETRTLLSSDGSWWWDGRRWLAALTEDGLWRWDGSAWSPTVDLASRRPSDLAAMLALLAEERFAQAGAILAARAAEWRPDPNLQDLVEQSREAHRRLQAVDEQSGSAIPNQGLGAVLGRLGIGADERRQLREERERLGAELRQLMAQVGRGAPEPSVKEADEILLAARSLDDRGALLGAAAAQLVELEHARSQAEGQARREIALAEEAREQALHQARMDVETAEAAHALAIDEVRARLRRVRTPGAGEIRAELGPLRLHDLVVDTPDGAIAAAGAGARVGSATELWEAETELLSDLVALGTAGSQAFHEALVAASGSPFVLITGRTGATVWPCPAGQEQPARDFAAALSERSAAAAAARSERSAEAASIERELRAAGADRSALKAAEAELARIEADPALLDAVEAARARAEAALAEPGDLAAARERLDELFRQATQPPPPLGAG